MLDAVGVPLVDPVNPHLQADLASKYGLLFVLLTFVGFLMFELIKQLRIQGAVVPALLRGCGTAGYQ